VAPARVRFDGLDVLVVDDQADSRELLAVMFEDRGAHALRCASATAALDLLEHQPVQLLVADIGMPDVDGHELIRRLRARGTTLPAIAVSAYAHAEERHRAIASGYLAYCPKPVDESRLFEMISGILGR
jgi:CheY-like chemotaxis protein